MPKYTRIECCQLSPKEQITVIQALCYREEVTGTKDMAPSVNSLPYKIEDLSSDSQHLHESYVWQHAGESNTGMYLAQERSCLKIIAPERERELLTSGLHMHAPTCERT